MDNETYSDWTACEMYGHRYTVDGDTEVHTSCVDCGEPFDPEDVK